MARVLSEEQREKNRLRCKAWAEKNRELARQRAREWYASNKERAKESFQQKRAADFEAYSERRREHWEKHKTELNAKRNSLPSDHPTKAAARERIKAWNAANPDKKRALELAYYAENAERLKERVRSNRKANPGVYAAASARKKAGKAQRTPKWLTAEDHAAMAAMYKLAAQKTKETGQVWHVDHIIPLRGKTVCGLHVPANLQVILGSENLKKRNRF